jgi:hypothetical protein
MSATPGVKLTKVLTDGDLRHLVTAGARHSPICAIPMAPAANELELWNRLAPLLVSQFFSWHADQARGRLALFIENKAQLKTMICALYVAVTKAMEGGGLPACDPCGNPDYYQLSNATLADLQTTSDETPYGAAIRQDWTVPFNVACAWLMQRGVHLTTGDMGANLRQAQSRVYSDSGAYCMIMSTSALAEGVNMIRLNTLVIALVQTTRSSFLTVTKVKQILGRLDREDRGGVAYIPGPDVLKESGDDILPANILIDIGGRSTSLTAFAHLVSFWDIDLLPTLSKFLTKDDMGATLGQPALQVRLWQELKEYPGRGLVPYCTRRCIHAYPSIVVRRKKELASVTTMARLVRFLSIGTWFPVHVFAYGPEAVAVLVGLPPALCILLPILLSRKPKEYTVRAIERSRNLRLRLYLSARLKEIEDDTSVMSLYNRIANVLAKLRQDTLHPKGDAKVAGYTFAVNAYSSLVCAAQILYALDFVQCTQDLDRMASIWSTYVEEFRNALMMFDYIVGIVSEDIVLPVLHAQAQYWRRSPFRRTVGNDMFTSFRDAESAFSAAYDAPSDFLHGYKVTPTGRHVVDGPIVPILPDRLVENHMLVVMCMAAKCLVRYMKTDAENSFGQARTVMASSVTRKYPDKVMITQLEPYLTVSAAAPTRASAAAAGLPDDTIVRGVERYLDVDW